MSNDTEYNGWTRDLSLAAGAVYVPCRRCRDHEKRHPSVMVLLRDAHIDTDGPPFDAYYHEDCASLGRVGT